MKCEACGAQNPVDVDRCTECNHAFLSDADDKMEQLVQAASIPNLASLYKAGKDRGLIKPAEDYASKA